MRTHHPIPMRFEYNDDARALWVDIEFDALAVWVPRGLPNEDWGFDKSTIVIRTKRGSTSADGEDAVPMTIDALNAAHLRYGALMEKQARENLDGVDCPDEGGADTREDPNE